MQNPSKGNWISQRVYFHHMVTAPVKNPPSARNMFAQQTGCLCWPAVLCPGQYWKNTQSLSLQLFLDSMVTPHFLFALVIMPPPSLVSTLFSHYNFHVQFILHGLECLLFRTVGNLSPDNILGMASPVNGYLLNLIMKLACCRLALFLPSPKGHFGAYLSFKP